MTKVLSVGGSIIAPDRPATGFLTQFVAMITGWLEEDSSRRLILVTGGGAPARVYQRAYAEIAANTGNPPSDDSSDWIGIMATRLNAQLLKASFGTLCRNEVVCDPTAGGEFTGRVLVAAGWKPGFSTDNDAVLLAQKYGAKTVINLSNIEKVCTDDPGKNPDARPLDRISWKDFRNMIGDGWTPGRNTPFDPVASEKAEALGFSVICAAGGNIQNVRNILDDKDFVGTRIG